MNHFSNGQHPKTLSILGSTGSIGTQTLDIVRLFPERFRVHALVAGSNVELLAEQARTFQPEVVVIEDENRLSTLQTLLAGTGIRIQLGIDAVCESTRAADVVVAAMVGFAGLRPVMTALEAGKTVALANKETLVVAGALARKALEQHGGTLIPVDSEHSAIYQCLVGEPADRVETLILTASGGPFRARSADTFDQITRAEALAHPNWTMGAKITIDSATMMNKGLEVIEARWIFGMEAKKIEVMVHPQSIIHSMVTFVDGSTKAQLGIPDMKVPIQYALTYPDRWPAPHPRIDWTQLRQLDFEPPDLNKFPCLRLAQEALAAGGTAPAVLNAANEAAVAAFLRDQIRFVDIPRFIADALEALPVDVVHDVPTLEATDREARRYVSELISATVH